MQVAIAIAKHGADGLGIGDEDDVLAAEEEAEVGAVRAPARAGGMVSSMVEVTGGGGDRTCIVGCTMAYAMRIGQHRRARGRTSIRRAQDSSQCV